MLLRESTPPAEPARVIHTAAREYEYTLCSFGSFSIVSYLVPVWRIACTFAGIVKGSWLSRLHHRGSPSHVLPSNTTIHATSRGGQSIQTCDWRTYYSPSQYRDWQVPSRANLWKEKDRKVGEGGSAPSAGGVSTLSSHTSLIRNRVYFWPQAAMRGLWPLQRQETIAVGVGAGDEAVGPRTAATSATGQCHRVRASTPGAASAAAVIKKRRKLNIDATRLMSPCAN